MGKAWIVYISLWWAHVYSPGRLMDYHYPQVFTQASLIKRAYLQTEPYNCS